MNIQAEKKREAAYWKERFNIMAAANSKMSQQTYDEVVHAFDLAQKDIQRDIDAWMNRFASNNGITLAEAKKLLNSQELKEFKWDVWEYIKHGKEYGINGKWAKELENASARLRITRLEALKTRVQNHLETAFAVENKAVDKLVKDVYKTSYYRTAFEFQKGSGIGFDVIGLDEKRLDTIAHKPWTTDRRTFSDRIWERKDQMVNSLHQELTRNCIYGRSRKDAVKELEQFVGKNVKNAKYCAARVVKTETAALSSKSQYESLLDLGCEMYEIYLPLKSTSCEICKEMNGKRFKTSEYEVGATAPPFHPNCDNGTLIPYYDDDLFKDDPPEGAEEIPDNISYEEWEKKFVNNSEKGEKSSEQRQKPYTVGKQNGAYKNNFLNDSVKTIDKERDKVYNVSEDQTQYAEYKALLGKNAPQTLKDFQKIKYSGVWDNFRAYANAIDKGELTTLADFDLYQETSQKMDNTLIGIVTSNNITITGKSAHSIARVIGSVEQKRSGVSVSDILEVLTDYKSEVLPVKVMENGRSQKFRNNVVEVSINPDTGNIIQVNPSHERKSEKS